MTAPGDRVLGFTLEEKKAEGGFGEVWRARDAAGRAVAVKFATSDVGARGLREEHRLLARLSTVRGIPGVRAFEDGETPRLALDWVGERSLRDLVRDVRSEDDRARSLGLFLRLVETLALVHGRGIVHGDLKPENLLVDDASERAYVVDFGLASEVQRSRLDRSLSASMRTEEGPRGGTLAYLPPEAVKGAEPSMRGDVYALGVILHELLLGRRPDKATGPETLRRLLPEPVLAVLFRALAFEPQDRYASANDMARALREIEHVLTARGARRVAHATKRAVVAGFAAFFVALRYVSVAALVALYGWIVIMAVVVHPAIALIFLPILLLHVVIRWEGPESPQEAALRQSRQVVGAKPRWRG